MKGIILAGGLGSRLKPLTDATNKHLLPIYDRPMVSYPIQTLVDAGIDDIMIVTGGPHAGDFIRVLKNGETFGLKKLHYAYQEGEGGIAQALSMAETFVGGEDCAVVLGDNIIADNVHAHVHAFKSTKGCMVFVKEVTDPERFGVIEWESKAVKDIIEKPICPPSNDAVIGLYLYDNTVFSKIKALSPSARGELEVTDLNKMYLADNQLEVRRITGTWLDCGTPDSMAEATSKFYNDSKGL
jgi:glucose-1-phosphate thymidylyltransferase